jgi:hypothetical protein
MIGLLLLTLGGLAGFTWWSLLKAKEQARTAASRTCREHGLLLMDDTVVLDSVQLKKEQNSRGWRLSYRFEFAKEGVLHKEGNVLIAPGQRAVVVIKTSNGQVIQEI